MHRWTVCEQKRKIMHCPLALQLWLRHMVANSLPDAVVVLFKYLAHCMAVELRISVCQQRTKLLRIHPGIQRNDSRSQATSDTVIGAYYDRVLSEGKYPVARWNGTQNFWQEDALERGHRECSLTVSWHRGHELMTSYEDFRSN